MIHRAITRLAPGRSAKLCHTLIHSGQHYDPEMSAQFFEELPLPGNGVNLGIRCVTHGAMVGRMIEGLEQALTDRQADAILVYGDTNTTLAGAIAGMQSNLPVGHIEAGLRSFNRSMPEERNRVLVDHAATWHFCPTPLAVSNLRQEGIQQHVYQLGDVMYDAALWAGQQPGRTILDTHGLEADEYWLLTIHRATNTDNPENLQSLLVAAERLSAERPVVFPCHPRTARSIEKHGLQSSLAELCLLPPVGFLQMMCLEKHARAILTDSGGVQKEACFHETPCITLREETEWPETVESGWNRLVGTCRDEIVAAATQALPGSSRPDFGDGHAAQRIVETLASLLNR